MKIKKCVIIYIIIKHVTINLHFNKSTFIKGLNLKIFKTLTHVYQTILKLKYFINYLVNL